MESNYDKAQERTVEALAYLATGCLELEQDYWQNHPITILPPNLQQGWNILAEVCLLLKIQPPQNFDELNKWLHTPIEEWQGFQDVMHESGITGSFLWRGSPRDLCYDLRADSNPRILQQELDQRIFRRAYEICKKHNLDEVYRSVRHFIATHPYLPDGQLEINQNALLNAWTEEIRKLVVNMYEEIPLVSRFSHDDIKSVILCPHCGWTLKRTHLRDLVCHQAICSKLNDLRFPENKWYQRYNSVSLRTKPGIQFFIVSPEQELLRLHEYLETLGLKCELWSGVDEFDLYVEFGDESWAIDVKDYSTPRHLAENLNKSGFSQVRKWDRAFFVVPEHRKTRTYRNIVERIWNNQDKRVDFLFLDELIDAVKEQLS